VCEQTDSLDKLLGSALDAHIARVSVQQNDDMRRISAWIAIAAGPTVVCAIYGMNFQRMPELHWRYGYFMVLSFIAAGCIAPSTRASAALAGSRSPEDPTVAKESAHRAIHGIPDTACLCRGQVIQ
jgi:hypothetical protein